MKITKVIIRNFKHFQETEFVVSGDNVIVAGQVFFPCTGAWEKIKNALRLKFDDNVWQHLADDTSETFCNGREQTNRRQSDRRQRQRTDGNQKTRGGKIMADEMKINLYEVENHSDIEMVLNEIKDMDLKNRVRLVNGYDMKLEEIKTETYEGVKIYLMDFSKHRISGPGRSAPDKITQDFSLQPDEGFGEMVATLYVSLGENAYILIQYNHYSCRAGSIAKYLNEMGDINCFFKPSLKDDILAKMNSSKYGKTYKFSYATEHLTPEHKKYLGVGGALDTIEEKAANHIGTVSMAFKKNKGKSRRLKDFHSFIENYLILLQKTPEQ